MLRKFGRWLERPIPIDSLVVFRIAYGLLMVWEALRYLHNGWVTEDYSNIAFRFAFIEWIRPLSPFWMEKLFLLSAVFALMVAAGLFYRLSIISFTLLFTYFFLIDKANYLNHFYLICLLAFLQIFIPANRQFSLDVYWRKVKPLAKVPNWCLWILLTQLALCYFYGGIAKIKYDWLISGEPLHTWLTPHAMVPLIGPYLLWRETAILLSWAAMLLDLCVVPLLLWRRTRLIAIIFLMSFHLSNAYLFSIGVFPWLMIAATSLFLPPNWPKRLGLWNARSTGTYRLSKTSKKWLIPAGALYFFVQFTLPLRHHFIPGDVNWTKEGSRFSWRMKLNTRSSNAQYFYTSDRAPNKTPIDLKEHLTDQQRGKVKLYSEMARQFARHLREKLEKQGHKDVKIFLRSEVSLNRKPAQILMDGNTDISR